MRRGDRGAIPLIMLILAGIFVTAAGVTTVVIATNTQGDNPGGFTLAVTDASASRNTDGSASIRIGYAVDYQSDAAAAAVSNEPVVVRCGIFQNQLTRDRVFTAKAEAADTARKVTGTISIDLTDEDDRGVQGVYGVTCDMVRGASVLRTVVGPKVTIPGPDGSASPSNTASSGTPQPSDTALPTSDASAAPSVEALVGAYTAKFVRVAGSTVDCVVDDDRTFRITATGETTLTVALDGTRIFAGKLDNQRGFAADVSLYPGFPDYYGTLDGNFSDGETPELTVRAITKDPVCTFSFTATKT